MKTLVLNASPKKSASDTMHITRAFLEGMEQISQNEVKVVDLYDKHIEYCKGVLCMHAQWRRLRNCRRHERVA